MRRQLTYHKLGFLPVIISLVTGIGSWIYILTQPSVSPLPEGIIVAMSGIFFSILALVVFFIRLLFVAMQRKKLEFDQNFLYIKRKSEEESISLKRILGVSATGFSSMRLAGRWVQYKIMYTDSGDKKKSIRFRLYWSRRPDFKIFLSIIRENNPAVDVNHFALPFDFIFPWHKVS